MIGHVVVLSRLCHKPHIVRLIMTFQYRILWRSHYMIGHVVVLSHFRDRTHPVQSILTVQFWFQHRQHLYDRSCHCSVSSSSHTIHYPLGLDNLVSHSMDITLVWSIMSLFCLVFIIECVLSDQSWQLSFFFGVEWTCMIDHIVVLSHFFSYTAPTWSITPLFCIVYMIDRILFALSWQFNSNSAYTAPVQSIMSLS